MYIITIHHLACLCRLSTVITLPVRQFGFDNDEEIPLNQEGTHALVTVHKCACTAAHVRVCIRDLHPLTYVPFPRIYGKAV